MKWSKKLLLFICCSFLLLGILPVASYAENSNMPNLNNIPALNNATTNKTESSNSTNKSSSDTSASNTSSPSSDIAPILTEDKLKNMKKPDYGERFTASIFVSIADTFIKLLGAQDVSYLVFQRDDIAKDNWLKDGFLGKRDALILGIFPEKYFDGIAMFYDSFNRILPIPMAVLMALVGLLLLISNFNTETRSNVKSYFAGFIYLVLAMRFGTVIIEILFDINYFFVDIVYATLADHGIKIGRFVDTIWGDQSGYNTITSQGGLGIALLAFCATFMTFVLNYQYSIRMIMLSIMILLFPVVIIGLIFPSKRQAFAIWVSEVTSHIFVQSAHALALGLFFYMRHYMGDMSFWLITAYFFGLPTIVGLMQKITSALTGVPSGGGNPMMGGLGSMMGLAALMNTGKMIGSLRGKGGFGKSAKDMKEMTDGKMNDSFGSFTDSIDSSKGSGGKGSIPLSNGGKGSFIGNIAKSAAKVGGTGAMAAVGAGISTMATGNPMMGLVGGGMVGSKVSGAVVDGASSIMDNTGNLIKDSRNLMKENEGMSFGEAFKQNIGFQDSSQFFDPEQAGQIGQNLAGTPGMIAGKAIARGNQAAHLLTGGKYGQGKVNTLQNLKQLEQKRNAAVTNYQNTQPLVAKAKVQRDHAQSMYGKGSTYHNGLVQNYERAKQNYETQKTKLDSINKNQNPGAYQSQSSFVNNAKSEMNHHLLQMNTPHPELRNAIEHFNEISAQSSGYQLEVSDLSDSINRFYADDNNLIKMNMEMEELRTEKHSRGEL